MKKAIFIITTIVILLPQSVKAQQMPHLTNYMLNEFMFNPAVVGIYKNYKINVNYRYQWLGFPVDAPQTLSFAVYGPHDKLRMGYGGYFYSDVVGTVSQTGAMGSYGYNINIGEELQASFGASFGLLQFKIDPTQLRFADNIYDPSLAESIQPIYKPDANIGVLVYKTMFYAGFSAHRLLGGTFEYGKQSADSTLSGINRLKHTRLAKSNFK